MATFMEVRTGEALGNYGIREQIGWETSQERECQQYVIGRRSTQMGYCGGSSEGAEDAVARIAEPRYDVAVLV